VLKSTISRRSCHEGIKEKKERIGNRVKLRKEEEGEGQLGIVCMPGGRRKAVEEVYNQESTLAWERGVKKVTNQHRGFQSLPRIEEILQEKAGLS